MKDGPTQGTQKRLRSVDIARLAGVSVSAVSLALNNRPGLGDETRARILQVAQEHNWRPHRAARSLKGAASDTVGLVLARPARTLGLEPFFGSLLSGLQDKLSREPVALQLLIVDDTHQELETYNRWAAEQRVDGFIVLDQLLDDPRPARLQELNMPAVQLGTEPSTSFLSCVWIDDYEAMRTIVGYLVALGHKNIGHISGTPEFVHTAKRQQATKDYANEFGIVIQTQPTDFTDQAGATATRALLSSANRPTALVFDSDVMALAGLGVAQEMGMQVPEELSIISFDDSMITRTPHPSITALTRDTYGLGVTVATELLRRIKNPGEPRSIQEPTPVLEVRESTAKLRHNP